MHVYILCAFNLHIEYHCRMYTIYSSKVVDSVGFSRLAGFSQRPLVYSTLAHLLNHPSLKHPFTKQNLNLLNKRSSLFFLLKKCLTGASDISLKINHFGRSNMISNVHIWCGSSDWDQEILALQDQTSIFIKFLPCFIFNIYLYFNHPLSLIECLKVDKSLE